MKVLKNPLGKDTKDNTYFLVYINNILVKISSKDMIYKIIVYK